MIRTFGQIEMALQNRLLFSMTIIVVGVVSLASAQDGSVDELSNTAAQDIKTILQIQTKAWNEADIPAFMKYYWKSDKLTFSSGGTTRRGWQATMDSYKTRYPTPQKMGHLTFSNLEVQVLRNDVALVLGNWNLKRRQDEDLGGNFSLVLRKIDGNWLIIHDHSSSLKKD